MSAICLLDTSIFVEILNVPFMAGSHREIVQTLQKKIEDNETLFLPMATILEAGNHIAQNGDGNQRRQCAERFVTQVRQALTGESPFKPISFLKIDELQQWLAEFPDSAMNERGLGDLSIIHDWQRLCRQNSGRRVYIWTLDGHLGGYDQRARI
jgi:hypothetical protein